MRAPAAALVALALIATAAFADWLQPDPSYRDAQFMLRAAIRDTVGQGANPVRLDTLGVALLRLARFEDATKVFRRVLELDSANTAARAAFGKMALFADRPAEAESLLTGLTDDSGARADLFAARVRLGEYARAAELAEDVNQTGRAELLKTLADGGAYLVEASPAEAKVSWVRSYPVPLVSVKLNGQSVLMAVDLGASDVLLDPSAARLARVRTLGSQSVTFWCGARLATRNALVQKLEIGGCRITRIPAGILPLRKWSLEVNPQGAQVAGVIGLNLLRRFVPTLDYEHQRLELRPAGTAPAPGPDAVTVPFEIWGESELTVYGSLAGGRRMAMVVQSGVPGCGVGAPSEVFDEIGVKAGMLSRVAKGAGAFLQGRPWSAVVVPTVAVGAVVRDKVPGWSGALDSAELWRHGVRRDALLSHDFFRDRRVTIDWQGRKLIFEGGD